MRDTEPDLPWEATRRGIAETMAEIDGALPGSVVVRNMRCGKRGCACKAKPPALHGPYIQWTRTVDGKTVTKFLSEDQLARYQPGLTTPDASRSSSRCSTSHQCTQSKDTKAGAPPPQVTEPAPPQCLRRKAPADVTRHAHPRHSRGAALV